MEDNIRYTVGLDLSLDHGGIVVLDVAGNVVDAGFITTVQKYAKLDERAIVLSKIDKGEAKEHFRVRRFQEYFGAICDHIQAVRTMVQVENVTVQFCLEGYAFNAKSTGILQIAELTGFIKHKLWYHGAQLRIHDPLSVKMFATGSGSASKKDVVNWANGRDGMEIPEEILKQVKKKKRGVQFYDYDGPGTDLADAFTLAKMLHVEGLVNRGTIQLCNLPEGQRKLFLRVTKSNPVNLLARPMEL